MVADGRITEEDFNRVSALMRTDRRRFGEALVQAGVMDRYDVGASVEQSKVLIDDLMRGPDYREGVAALTEKRVPRF